jgi:glycosyltransferase involved in cell wall biosynthesis
VVTFGVIVPAHNSSATIESALRSAVEQTYPPREVIVIDDGSTDDTAAIAARFGEPVRVLGQPNRGTAAARNRGILEATTDVIAFLDADDRYEPDRLERIAARFEREPQLDAVATDALVTSPERTFRAADWWPAGPTGHVDLRTPLIFCALAIRSRVMAELGEFDSRYRNFEDAEMFYRLLCRGYSIGFVNEPSYVYRVRATGKTGTPSVRSFREHASIQFRYAFARETPHSYRLRLVVRGLRLLRSLVRTWLAARRGAPGLERM